MENVTLKVKGMSCEHCAKAVKDALAGTGVRDASVCLETGTVSFSHDPNLAPLGVITDAITDEGYGVIG